MEDDGLEHQNDSLNAEFGRIVGLGVVVLVVVAGLLGMVWEWSRAGQWVLQTGLLWGFVGYQAGRLMHLNRADGDAPVYEELGWGNRLTLVRSWLIAAVGGFLFQPWPDGPMLTWLPGTLYFFAAVLDRVDGYVARRTGHGSLLGQELDMVSDALGLAVASLLAVGYGQVHPSYLLFGAAYYLFHGGLMCRERLGLPIFPLPLALHRRAWAGFQMGFLVVTLWPLFGPPVTSLAGFAFMLPALIGFFIDWFTVSGLINRDSEAVDCFFRKLSGFGETVAQPALRLAIVVQLAVTIGLSRWPNDVWIGVVALSILLGIAGRAVCLVIIGLLGWHYSGQALGNVEVALLCSTVWLMLLGTGRFSLWQRDDYWINRYDGAPPDNREK